MSVPRGAASVDEKVVSPAGVLKNDDADEAVVEATSYVVGVLFVVATVVGAALTVVADVVTFPDAAVVN